MSQSHRLSRRRAIALGAAASLPLVHIRTAGAAGKLSVGFWDHWVPKGDEVLRKQIQTWADRSKVDVQIDLISSAGNKLLFTAAAESQAGSGHDMLTMFQFDPNTYADKLEPVDETIRLISDQCGSFNPACEYLAKVKGHWMAVPSATGSLCRPCLARISLMKELAGIDLRALYPAHPVDPPEAAGWTYDAFLKAGEACKKAGYPFGLGLGTTGDSIGNAAVWFAAYGAELIDAEGNITVNSANVREALESGQKLVKILPDDALSYDDASDNRLMIAGRTALIYDAPSPYAVAKRDAPKVAEDMWSFPNPAGPNGRFIPYVYAFTGIWSFSRNKPAAKDLIVYLSQRSQFEERTTAVDGYDIPVLIGMADAKVWEEVGPPKGVMYNYPLRPWHQAVALALGSPAPPNVAAQIISRATMPTMLAKLFRGQSIKDVIAWAEEELEGFVH
jgi:ABC-type glycerol-3-phosphate transport system substrate-binding protein